MQLISIAFFYAWFVGSCALIFSVPILIEIQRETTVLVMQKQRETEMAQIQEQARMANGGIIENLKGTYNAITGNAPGGGPQ